MESILFVFKDSKALDALLNVAPFLSDSSTVEEGMPMPGWNGGGAAIGGAILFKNARESFVENLISTCGEICEIQYPVFFMAIWNKKTHKGNKNCVHF